MGPASGKECDLATRLSLPPAHPAPAHRDRQPLEKPATCLRSDARQCLRQSVLFYSQEPFVLMSQLSVNSRSTYLYLDQMLFAIINQMYRPIALDNPVNRHTPRGPSPGDCDVVECLTISVMHDK